MFTLRGLSIVVLVVALFAGAALLLQREVASTLRSEIELLREDNRKLARVRAEHDRLLAAQIPEAELQRLRADRAALMQLRAELDALRMRTEQPRPDIVSTPAPETASRPPRPLTPPALALKIAINPDGGLSLEDKATDLSALQQRLAAVPRGERVEVRLQMPDPKGAIPLTQIKQVVEGLTSTAKTIGLRIEIRYEQPDFHTIVNK